MKKQYDIACPNCKKLVPVMFDPNMPTEKGRGGFRLMGWTCWNCGKGYMELFKEQQGLPSLTDASLCITISRIDADPTLAATIRRMFARAKVKPWILPPS